MRSLIEGVCLKVGGMNFECQKINLEMGWIRNKEEKLIEGQGD